MLRILCSSGDILPLIRAYVVCLSDSCFILPCPLGTHNIFTASSWLSGVNYSHKAWSDYRYFIITPAQTTTPSNIFSTFYLYIVVLSYKPNFWVCPINSSLKITTETFYSVFNSVFLYGNRPQFLECNYRF